METQKGNKFMLPLAIIVAGALIAFAIYVTQKDKTVVVNPTETPKEIAIREVDATDHILGNPKAPILLVEYSDTECPFCKGFHTTMQKLMETSYAKDGKIAWVYRNFPIESLHSKAPVEAGALECASELGGNNKFWEFTNLVYKTTNSNDSLDITLLPTMAESIGLNKTEFETCLSSARTAPAVQADLEDAAKAGGRGTPFTVIVSNKKISSGVKVLIESATVQLGLPIDTLVISKDERRIAVNGNMPFELMDQLVQELLK